MTRLLLRISLAIFAASAIMFFIGHSIFGYWAKRTMESSPPGPTLAAMDALRQQMVDLSPEALEQELRRQRELLQTNVELLELSSRRIPAKVRARLEAEPRRGAIAFRHNQPMLYIPLRQKVVVAGPLPGLELLNPWIVASVLGLSILVVGLTGFFLSVGIVRRLRRLERAAEQFGQGDLGARADLGSRDAIGSLAGHFNVMAHRLQRLIENQRLLLQAVSHELRTPTARIRFGLEMLSSADSEVEKQERIASIDDDLTELDDLVEELLVFNRFEDGAPPQSMEPIAVGETIRGVVERLGHLRAELVVEVTDGQPPCQLVCDARSFSRAMQNLLSNAMRHAQQRVTVRCGREGESVVVAVCDDGPGIPPSERQRVLEPFARLEDSRSRESGGAGLGLAIVQRIVAAHQGTIIIDEGGAGGARVVTTWPGGGPTRP